jgi:hypothetical protein
LSHLDFGAFQRPSHFGAQCSAWLRKIDVKCMGAYGRGGGSSEGESSLGGGLEGALRGGLHLGGGGGGGLRGDLR